VCGRPGEGGRPRAAVQAIEGGGQPGSQFYRYSTPAMRHRFRERYWASKRIGEWSEIRTDLFIQASNTEDEFQARHVPSRDGDEMSLVHDTVELVTAADGLH